MGSHQPHHALRAALLTAAVLLQTATASEDIRSEKARFHPSLPPLSLGVSLGVPALLNVHLRQPLFSGLETEIALGGFAVPTSALSVAVWNLDLTARYTRTPSWLTFGLTARYLGLGVNGRAIGVPAAEATADEGPRIRLGVLALVPQVGLKFEVQPGLLLLFDVGVQIPLITGGSITSSRAVAPVGPAPSTLYEELGRAAPRTLSHLARFPLPTVSLFRLSWEI